MTSSDPKRNAFRNVPPPEGGAKPAYARFIPREELNSFAAWTPGSIAGGPGDRRQAGVHKPAPEAPKVDAAVIAEQMRAARQSGYQDGYRDGLVALEGFKQSFATQMTAQLGLLAASFGEQLDGLQQEMARAFAVTATQLAMQVVRGELKTRPELIADVANEAIEALLLSAQHVTLRVHPDDHALVAEGAADVLLARGGRLVNDPGISRGGLLVESDIGVVDATVEARWRRASGTIGCESEWQAETDELQSIAAAVDTTGKGNEA